MKRRLRELAALIAMLFSFAAGAQPVAQFTNEAGLRLMLTDEACSASTVKQADEALKGAPQEVIDQIKAEQRRGVMTEGAKQSEVCYVTGDGYVRFIVEDGRQLGLPGFVFRPVDNV